MASTYTTRLRLELQADGENSNTWGDKVNTVFELVDEAMDGYLAKSVAGASDVTLGTNNSASDEERNRVFKFTGTLTGNIDVIFAAEERWLWVWNDTSGAFTLGIKPSGGTAVDIPQGYRCAVYSDGSTARIMSPLYKASDGGLQVQGALDVDGATTLNGNVDLGDSASDTVTFNGDVDSDIIPDADDSRDLGSASFRWAEMHADKGYLTEVNDGQLAGYRNFIMNGAMAVHQRQQASTINEAYGVDRFLVGTVGSPSATYSVNQSSAVAPSGFQFSFHVDVTGADAGFAASQSVALGHRIEGYNCHPLGLGTSWAKQVTLSFWVRSPKTGTHCVAFRNYNSGTPNRSYVTEYTVSSADTWEKKTITLTLDTSGTWDTGNDTGLYITWSLGLGSTYQTTKDSWQTGDYLGTSSQVNIFDSTSNNFYLTGVQLEIGDTATPFERRPFGTELALCQRYYQKSYNYGDAPGTVTGTGLIFGRGSGNSDTGNGQAFFPVQMARNPDVTFYSTNDGNADEIHDASSSVDRAVSSYSYTNTRTPGRASCSTVIPDGNLFTYHYVAEGELP